MDIACIGGGTGLHTALKGLKEYTAARLSAIVSMMDSGGSSGRLRDEFGYLPPGDVRQCLVALSDAPFNAREFLEFRSQGFDGHPVGNILLTLCTEITGNEYSAIQMMETFLHIERGHVYPVTLDNVHLKATYSDGSTIIGETHIDRRSKTDDYDATLRITNLQLTDKATIFTEAQKALLNAKYIIIGPGDLYTSIMPNLLVDGMVDTLKAAKAKGAKIIYITNTMTKDGETNGFKASDFVNAVQSALDGATIDIVIANTGKISAAQRRAYALENAEPVECDLKERVIKCDLVSNTAFARHDGKKLAYAIKDALSDSLLSLAEQ